MTAYSSPRSTRGSRASASHYTVGIDGIALALMVLTAVLMPLVVLAGWKEQEEARRTAARATSPSSSLLEAMMIGVFAAMDVFLFYVLFEAMLIPVYFMIGRYGGAPTGRYAAMKFLLYSLSGGLIMLASVIGVYG